MDELIHLDDDQRLFVGDSLSRTLKSIFQKIRIPDDKICYSSNNDYTVGYREIVLSQSSMTYEANYEIVITEDNVLYFDVLICQSLEAVIDLQGNVETIYINNIRSCDIDGIVEQYVKDIYILRTMSY